jgi:coenzyme F420-0:L-glutamate ligase/coenzyme F420-1:gamma-L-glutamate ligase
LSGLGELRALPIEGLPEIGEGTALGQVIVEGLRERGTPLQDGDVLLISQKIVSKAEGRVRRLSAVTPSTEAERLAGALGKEPALIELILSESRAVLRAERGVLITETRHGFVCANAGIDRSNLPEPGTAALLPEDPDASARRIREEIQSATEATIGVIVSDSFGRAWRLGQAEAAIGCAGIAPLDDWRGRRDANGTELAATQIAVADEIAAAGDLTRDKANRVPAVVVRGVGRFVTDDDGPGAAALRRPAEDDLFR